MARIGMLPAHEALEVFLSGKNPWSSRYALSALSEIDPVPKAVWKTLEARLASDRPILALATLRSMGTRARPLMPKILPLLSDDGSRWLALQTLESMGEPSLEARAALKPLLKDPDERLRAQVRDLLGSGNK